MRSNPVPDIGQLVAAFPEVQHPQLIAQGGFKHVFCATIGGSIEAFKLLALPAIGTTESERAARREYIGRAQREIELLGRFEAPEIVKLGSLAPREVTIAGVDYLGYSEEYLQGESLDGYIKRQGPLPPEKVVKQLFLSLLRAIRQIWAFETVHRDIKPLNVIMLGRPDRPFVLLDLGIAYQVREPALTIDPGIRPATLPYMAPEMLQANFRQSLDFRADVYTAGITTFEFAAQRHPLPQDTADALHSFSAYLRQPPLNLQKLRPDLSPEFCGLIDQTLKKSPPLRPGNLGALITKLEAEL